jgi:hypothetical protein
MPRLSGLAVAEIGVGGILVYSGMKGSSIADTFSSLLNNKTPSDTEPVSGSGSGFAYTSSAADSGTAPAAKGNYTIAQIEQLWTSQGGDSDTAAFAAAVAMSESSGDADATSPNPNGGTNTGLWQLDTAGVGFGYTVAELQNPETNAQITVLATDNGRNWVDWGDPVTEAVNYQYTPGEAVPGA